MHAVIVWLVASLLSVWLTNVRRTQPTVELVTASLSPGASILAEATEDRSRVAEQVEARARARGPPLREDNTSTDRDERTGGREC
jgi:hypothetical protein